MATYFIDFENVGSDGLCGTENLTENDNVLIFYSSNSGKITMKMHQCICKSRAGFEYFEISAGGKNALDFQLSTYLGFLIANGKSEQGLYIISKDRGFDHVINFWLEQNNTNAPIIRKTSIDAPDNENTVPDEEAPVANDIIEFETDIYDNTDNPEDEYENLNGDIIKSVIQNMDDITSHNTLHKKLVFKLGNVHGTNVYRDLGTITAANKQEFHRKMVAKYGQANGTVIYNKLKKLIRK